MRFEKPGRNIGKTNLGKPPFKRLNVDLLERHTASRECRGRLPEARIVAAREPQNTGLLKKRLLAPCGKEFLPLDERPLRPPRIDFIRAVAHSNDA